MHSFCALAVVVELHMHHGLCGLHGLPLCLRLLRGGHRTDLCLCVVPSRHPFLRRVLNCRDLYPTLCRHRLLVRVPDIYPHAHALCSRGSTNKSLRLLLVLRPCVLANAISCALDHLHVSHRALVHAPGRGVSTMVCANRNASLYLRMRLFQNHFCRRS